MGGSAGWVYALGKRILPKSLIAILPEVLNIRDTSHSQAFWLYTFILSWFSLVEHILVGCASVFQTQEWFHFALPGIQLALPSRYLSWLLVLHQHLDKKPLSNFFNGRNCGAFTIKIIATILTIKKHSILFRETGLLYFVTFRNSNVV